MRDSFEVQNNVNRTVKDSVKDIVLWIERVELDHEEIISIRINKEKKQPTSKCSKQLKKTERRDIRC